MNPLRLIVRHGFSNYGAWLPLIQFVTNLSQIGNNRFTVVAVPLAIKGGDASPVRVIALVE